MGFSCERVSPSEPRFGPGESPLDGGGSHAEDGPIGAAESPCTWEGGENGPSRLVSVGVSFPALRMRAGQLEGGNVVMVVDYYR